MLESYNQPHESFPIIYTVLIPTGGGSMFGFNFLTKQKLLTNHEVLIGYISFQRGSQHHHASQQCNSVSK